MPKYRPEKLQDVNTINRADTKTKTPEAFQQLEFAFVSDLLGFVKYCITSEAMYDPRYNLAVMGRLIGFDNGKSKEFHFEVSSSHQTKNIIFDKISIDLFNYFGLNWDIYFNNEVMIKGRRFTINGAENVKKVADRLVALNDIFLLKDFKSKDQMAIDIELTYNSSKDKMELSIIVYCD